MRLIRDALCLKQFCMLAAVLQPHPCSWRGCASLVATGGAGAGRRVCGLAH